MISDIRRIIHATFVPAGVAARTFVHIQSHGALQNSDDELEAGVNGVHALDFEPDSPLNCGMLAATEVAVGIEGLLLDRRPTFTLRGGRTLTIRCEHDIRTLLHEVYGFDGYFAGDWVRSIDDLRTHARGQRGVMERAFASDPEFRRLDIQVTAGIQDYRHHRHLRTDAEEIDAPFWDDLHAAVRARAEQNPEMVRRQGERQNPLAGLVAMSDVESSPRAVAANYLARKLNRTDPFPTLFTIAGSSYDLSHIPFGPYAITGMHYLLGNLETKDIGVMGLDEPQTARMVDKLRADPLMNFVLHEGDARIIPMPLDVVEHAQNSGLIR